MADFAIGCTMLDGCFYPRSLPLLLLFLFPFAPLLIIFLAHFLLLFLFPFDLSATQTTTQKKAEPLSDSA